MDIALENALDSLRQAGAHNVPQPSVVENSPAGMKWYGERRKGGRWRLIKHGMGSYNVEF